MQYLQKVKELQKRTDRQVTCESCFEEFSRMGIYSHQGSKACLENINMRPVKLVSEKIRDQLLKTHKTVPTTFILACERRKLLDLIGATKQGTKHVSPCNGYPHRIVEEWWVYFWVGIIYDASILTRKYPNPIYKTLEDVQRLPPNDRKSMINILLLRHTDL